MESVWTTNLLWIANPLCLTFGQYCFCTLVKFCAETLLDFVVVVPLYAVDYKKLPSRVPVPIMKGLERLEVKDYVCLFLNSFVSFNFLGHLANLVFFEYLPEVLPNANAWIELNEKEYPNYSLRKYIPLTFQEATFANAIASIYLVFLIDDFVYYFVHRIMHMPAFYPYVHKHHHRQSLPKRGIFDAANEHPLEQVFGLGAVWIALHAVMRMTGFHGVSIIVFFVIYAALAVLNHTPYDVQFPKYLGLGYNVRAHEMHHRLPRSNYAQNVMFFDKLFGTFEPYKESMVSKPERENN